MTKELERIEYTVYRGHMEPIIRQTKAVLIFYENHLEIVEDYLFTPTTLDGLDSVTSAHFLDKKGMDILLTKWCREDDPTNTLNPKVHIISSDFHFYVKTMKEAEFIYNKIKEWLLK